MARPLTWMFNGVVFGVAFSAGSELFRTYRGSARTCNSCHAPVGADGKWRGEREPRSYSVAWAVNPGEWVMRERVARRKRCHGCQKSLDSSSVIVLDRAWHRKCLKCSSCLKMLSGNKYYMLNNRIYDPACYREAKLRPFVERSHTALMEYRSPAIAPDDSVMPANTNNNDENSASTSVSPRCHLQARHSVAGRRPSSPSAASPNRAHVQPAFSRTSDLTMPPNLPGRRALDDFGERGKMSQEVKRQLAQELVDNITALRDRERRLRALSAAPELQPEEPQKRREDGVASGSRDRKRN